MAYLGAIARQNGAVYRRKTQAGEALAQLGGRVLCLNTMRQASSYRYNATTVRTAISGFVYENGVAVARTVRIYRRDTGEMIGSTVSASDGSYYLPLGYTSEVYVIAIDADGAPLLNAVISDYVVPV